MQVDQRVIYFILKELLNYSRVVKYLGYEKKINTIFAKVKQLVQQLQSPVTKSRIIWKSIILVIIHDSLHDDIEITTALLLHFGDKDLEEIQLIFTSTKATNLSKQVVRATKGDFALMAQKKQPKKSAKSKPGKECFNYRKKDHYTKDCRIPTTSNKRKPEELTRKAKCIR